MTKKIDKSKTIIKDDGVRIIWKNDIVCKVIDNRRPLTNLQRKKRLNKHLTQKKEKKLIIRDKEMKKNTAKKTVDFIFQSKSNDIFIVFLGEDILLETKLIKYIMNTTTL